MEPAADQASMLRRAGVRVTAPRLAVLAALAGREQHLTAEAIATAVRGRLGESSAQTVYNVLRTLTDVGLVRRIEPAGRAGLYELRTGDNHHHLVCRRCDAITDVDCVAGVAPCLEPVSAEGYVLDEAEVTFWGLCPRCRESGHGDAAPGS